MSGLDINKVQELVRQRRVIWKRHALSAAQTGLPMMSPNVSKAWWMMPANVTVKWK